MKARTATAVAATQRKLVMYLMARIAPVLLGKIAQVAGFGFGRK
jgi:hypothetical protein